MHTIDCFETPGCTQFDILSANTEYTWTWSKRERIKTGQGRDRSSIIVEKDKISARRNNVPFPTWPLFNTELHCAKKLYLPKSGYSLEGKSSNCQKILKQQWHHSDKKRGKISGGEGSELRWVEAKDTNLCIHSIRVGRKSDSRKPEIFKDENVIILKFTGHIPLANQRPLIGRDQTGSRVT